MTEKPRFVLDMMLGKVAKWLRILGYDALYSEEDPGDDSLLKKAFETGRVLVTGDRRLFEEARKRGVSCFFVDQKLSLNEKLAALVSGLGLSLDGFPSSVCPNCNFRLRVVEASDAEVPSDVRRRGGIVFVCEGCGQVYWRGSHWEKILKRIGVLKKMVSQEG